MAIPRVELERAIDAALTEDLALGDPTTDALIPPERQGRATMVAREPGIACGVDVAAAVFQRVDPTLSVTPLVSDGQALEAGGLMLSVEGAFASILSAPYTDRCLPVDSFDWRGATLLILTPASRCGIRRTRPHWSSWK